MTRIVEPEWLDELPADDAQAKGSRRDLARLNRIMGHARFLGEMLETGLGQRPLKRLVEIGAGDGRFALAVAKKLSPGWPGVEVTLVDCKPAVSSQTCAQFSALSWHVNVVQSDVFDWLRDPGGELADAIVANLFLHHFHDARLAEMLRLAAERTRIFAACEPCRGNLPLLFSRMVGLIGCNAVTRHDAVLSVKAGFSGREISDLWPMGWQTMERRRRLSQIFFAKRSS